MNNDFIDLVKQLRSTIKGEEKRVLKLQEKLQETPSIAEREWLLEKLRRLQK